MEKKRGYVGIMGKKMETAISMQKTVSVDNIPPKDAESNGE